MAAYRVQRVRRAAYSAAAGKVHGESGQIHHPRFVFTGADDVPPGKGPGRVLIQRRLQDENV